MGSVVLMGAAPAAALRQNKNQAPRPPGNGGTAPARDGVLATVPGTLVDLSAGFSGQVLYCTAEGEVGAFFGGDHGILAPLGTFAGQSLRAVTATPSEDIAVLTSAGDIYLLPGGGLPPVLTYDDLYMVLDPTDLMCDAAGNFLIASSTPSNGQRGLNWVSPGGDRWAYYLVQHSVHMPVQLAHDPLTGSVIFSDETGGGTLHRVIPGDSTHTTAPFETVLQPGIQSSLDDGDVVFECDGDYYWIAGNRIFFHNRSAGTTSLFQQLTHTLRGVAIAPASGDLASSGYSLYVAEGDDPTIVREYANVGIPAASFAPDQGWVPGFRPSTIASRAIATSRVSLSKRSMNSSTLTLASRKLALMSGLTLASSIGATSLSGGGPRQLERRRPREDAVARNFMVRSPGVGN